MGLIVADLEVGSKVILTAQLPQTLPSQLTVLIGQGATQGKAYVFDQIYSCANW